MKRILFVLMIVALLVALPGCAAASPFIPPVPEGQVWTMSAGSTIYTIKEALSGAHDTMILQSGNSYIFMKAWPNSGWGAAMVTEAQNQVDGFYHIFSSKGNLISAKDAGGFVKAMMDKGWQLINPNQVSDATRQALKDLSLTGTLATAMKALMAGFFVCPIGVNGIPPGMEMLERVKG